MDNCLFFALDSLGLNDCFLTYDGMGSATYAASQSLVILIFVLASMLLVTLLWTSFSWSLSRVSAGRCWYGSDWTFIAYMRCAFFHMNNQWFTFEIVFVLYDSINIMSIITCLLLTYIVINGK